MSQQSGILSAAQFGHNLQQVWNAVTRLNECV